MADAVVLTKVVTVDTVLTDIAPGFSGTGDGVVLIDAPTVYVANVALFGQVAPEKIVTTETATVLLANLVINVLDPLVVSETVSVLEPGARLDLSLLETVLLSETLTRVLTPLRPVLLDSLVTTETALAQRATTSLPLDVVVYDAVGVSTTILGDVAPGFMGTGESVVVTDAVTVSFLLGNLQSSVTDAVVVTDTLEMLMSGSTATLRPLLMDRVVLSETSSKDMPNLSLPVDVEKVVLSETVAVQCTGDIIPLVVWLTDKIGLGETVSSTYVSPSIWTFGEAIYAFCTVRLMFASTVTVTDAVVIRETVSVRLTPLRVVASDPVVVQDTPLAYVKDELSGPLLIFGLFDAVVLSESAPAVNPVSLVTLSEAVVLSETIRISGLNIEGSCLENVVLTDTVDVALTPLVPFPSDRVVLSESTTVLRTPLVVTSTDQIVVVDTPTVENDTIRIRVTELVTVDTTYLLVDEHPSVAPHPVGPLGPWFLYAHIL